MLLKINLEIRPSNKTLYDKLLTVPIRQRAEFIRVHASMAIFSLNDVNNKTIKKLSARTSLEPAPGPATAIPDAKQPTDNLGGFDFN